MEKLKWNKGIRERNKMDPQKRADFIGPQQISVAT